MTRNGNLQRLLGRERTLCKCWFFFFFFFPWSHLYFFTPTTPTSSLSLVRKMESGRKRSGPIERSENNLKLWHACGSFQRSSHVSALSWEAAGFLPWANARPCAFCCRLQVRSPRDVFTKGLGIPLICVGVLQNLALHSHWVQCQGSGAT